MTFKKSILICTLLIGCFGSNAVASDWTYDDPFNRQFISSANLIIELRDGDKLMTGNVKLGAFCRDKLRGVQSPDVDDNTIYLTIRGVDDEVMDFRVLLEDGRELRLPYTYKFVAEDMVGWEVPWQLNLFGLRATDVRSGGTYAAKGSLAHQSHLVLLGGWTANDITRLKYAAAGADGVADEVRSIDLMEAYLAGEAPDGGWLSGFPNVGTVDANELPEGVTASEFLAGVNANVLLFLPKQSKVTPQPNVVIGTYTPALVLKDGEPFFTLHKFNAKTASYTRSFSLPTLEQHSAGWETITLPFRPKKITSKKGKLAAFGSVEIEMDMYSPTNLRGYRPFWLRRPDGAAFTEALEILPYAAYIISMPNSSNYMEEYNIRGEVSFSANDVWVKPTPSEMPAAATDAYQLVPTLSAVKSSDEVYVLNREPMPADNLMAGAAFVRNSGDALPFRAYASPKGEHGVARYFIVDSNEVTSISRVPVVAPVSSGAAYDLSGRRLKGDEKGLRIMNHQKVIVR